MNQLKFTAPAPDAAYLAHVNTFFSTLFGLEIFKNGWPEEKLGSQDVLQNGVEYLRQKFEGGLTGNRFDIAARRMARKDLDMRIQKILYYLTVMADEPDVGVLLNSGVVKQTSRKRARKTVKPANAS